MGEWGGGRRDTREGEEGTARDIPQSVRGQPGFGGGEGRAYCDGRGRGGAHRGTRRPDGAGPRPDFRVDSPAPAPFPLPAHVAPAPWRPHRSRIKSWRPSEVLASQMRHPSASRDPGPRGGLQGADRSFGFFAPAAPQTPSFGPTAPGTCRHGGVRGGADGGSAREAVAAERNHTAGERGPGVVLPRFISVASAP